MKKILILCAVALTALGGISYAMAARNDSDSRKRVTRQYEVTNFSGIDASAGVEVEYVIADTISAWVEAPASIIDRVEIRQRGEMLNITVRPDGNRAYQSKREGKVRVTVSSPIVNTFIASSGADVTCLGIIECGNRDCSITNSSGADVDIAGVNCRNLCITSASGADAEIDIIHTQSVEANASSGADINLHGDMGSLKATCSSGSDIKLTGSAADCTMTCSSGGDINAKGLKAQRGECSASSSGDISCCISGKFSYTESSGGKVKNVL